MRIDEPEYHSRDKSEPEPRAEPSRVGWHVASAAAVLLWIVVMIATAGDGVGSTAVAVGVLAAYGGFRLLKR